MHGNLSANWAGKKDIQLKYFKRILSFKKKVLGASSMTRNSFQALSQTRSRLQVTFPSTSHDLSDTGADQQYTTGKIIGIKKANPPFCFNCQRGKKSEVTANTFKSTTVECQCPDSAAQTNTASLFPKNPPHPVSGQTALPQLMEWQP